MKILVSGASIAGPTVAYFLTRQGFDVTVVERAAAPRAGGSPIDIRGEAVHVAERMGILPRLLDAQTATERMAFVDATGKVVGSFSLDPAGARNPTSDPQHPERDFELRRDVLVSTLYEAAKDDVEYLFEDSIEALAQDDVGVDVTFASGGCRRFNVVVGADGLHSAVRRLAFGDEERYAHYLGLYVCVGDVDPELGRENWCVAYNSPGKLACIYRYQHDEADAMFAFRTPALTYDYRDIDQQKKLLIAAFENESWKVPELLDEVRAADDLYFDPVSQIRMPSWSRGRTVLVGDAAHCAAFLSGSGSTLAMVGAWILADELSKENGNPGTAFARYEERHRPLVQAAQSGVMRGASILIPATKAAIWRRNQLLRVARPGMAIASRLRRRWR